MQIKKITHNEYSEDFWLPLKRSVHFVHQKGFFMENISSISIQVKFNFHCCLVSITLHIHVPDQTDNHPRCDDKLPSIAWRFGSKTEKLFKLKTFTVCHQQHVIEIQQWKYGTERSNIFFQYRYSISDCIIGY